MEGKNRFVPLLTELGPLGGGFFYKHVAPNGAPALQRELFNSSKDDVIMETQVCR